MSQLQYRMPQHYSRRMREGIYSCGSAMAGKAVTCSATARQIRVIITKKTHKELKGTCNLFVHQKLYPMSFIQRKAFNYITVSYFREATSFAFPVLNDKGVACSFHTGCPENPNQVGRILRLTHSYPLLTSAQNPRKWSFNQNKTYKL